jgi:hypothetical protein
LTTYAAGKSNTSLGAMQMHATYYGGALATIPERKIHGVPVESEPEYS